MNYSRQRQLIWDAVTQGGGHPTAEELYQRLKPDNPALSLATVYRNLRQLEAYGRLDPHEHMICETCGRAVDLCLGLEPGLLDQIRQKTGAAVSGCRLVIWGQCEACRRADKSASGSI